MMKQIRLMAMKDDNDNVNYYNDDDVAKSKRMTLMRIMLT